MTRERLRPAYGDGDLAQVYAAPHQHAVHADHQLRVAVTIQVAHALAGPVVSAADLSCGDAAILKTLRVQRRYLGDYAPGHEFTGPIESTIGQIPPVDLFVCTETLEHLDDPDTTLKAVRGKTAGLILSTPVDAWGDDNPQHYWAWDRAEVEAMLSAAGFTVALYNELDVRPAGGAYSFGIWGCR